MDQERRQFLRSAQVIAFVALTSAFARDTEAIVQTNFVRKSRPVEGRIGAVWRAVVAQGWLPTRILVDQRHGVLASLVKLHSPDGCVVIVVDGLSMPHPRVSLQPRASLHLSKEKFGERACRSYHVILHGSVYVTSPDSVAPLVAAEPLRVGLSNLSVLRFRPESLVAWGSKSGCKLTRLAL